MRHYGALRLDIPEERETTEWTGDNCSTSPRSFSGIPIAMIFQRNSNLENTENPNDNTFCTLRELQQGTNSLETDQVFEFNPGKIILKSDHSVYIQGDNCTGVLGITPTKCSWIAFPRFSPHLSSLELSTLSFGAAHCVGLTRAGEVVTWGTNECGQCGRSKQSLWKLEFLEALGRVSHVACGTYHSLSLNFEGEIFAWGLNSHGQLGTGFSGCEWVPKRVRTSTYPVGIAAGCLFSLYLDEAGAIFYTGRTPEYDGVSSFIGRIMIPSLLNYKISHICVDKGKLAVYTHPKILSVQPHALFESCEAHEFLVSITSTRLKHSTFHLIDNDGREYQLSQLDISTCTKDVLSVVKLASQSDLKIGSFYLVVRNILNAGVDIGDKENTIRIIPRKMQYETQDPVMFCSSESRFASLKVKTTDILNDVEMDVVITCETGEFNIRTAAIISRDFLSFNSPLIDIESAGKSPLRIKLALGQTFSDPELPVIFWRARITQTEFHKSETTTRVKLTLTDGWNPDVVGSFRWELQDMNQTKELDPEVVFDDDGAIIYLVSSSAFEKQSFHVRVSPDMGTFWIKLPRLNEHEFYL